MVKGVAKKHWDSEPVYERFQAAAKQLRDLVDRLMPQMEFDAAAALPCAERALWVMELAAAVAEQYRQRKWQLGGAGLRRPADRGPAAAGRGRGDS